MLAETDLTLPDGTTLHTYDTANTDADLTIVWHHGTPNLGSPPQPLFRPDIRWISYDRPGYGTSTPAPGRTVAQAASLTQALAELAHVAEWDAGSFTPGDVVALDGRWAWVLSVVGPAQASGPGPVADDDIAFVRPWGFEPGSIATPVRVVHGSDDRLVPASHGRWLAEAVGGELMVTEGDGHITVLDHAAEAVGWMVTVASRG
ncbi:alpha/beta fold hydrolase [Actinokineospora sp. G85]|uniref:alpha/beta fold hydrolase n=1 Tax=Actinokineospora sp. G85 TaxID=3406626 RepID=UPI003C75F2E7